jgi:signal peptidase I
MGVRSAIVRAVRRTAAGALAVAAVAAAVGSLALAKMDLTPVAIYGTSMLPAIAPGDVVLMQRGAVPTQKGAVVTYTDQRRWITHRLRHVADDGSLVLRGDNNTWDDPPVATGDTVGVSRYVVPKLGMPVVWAHQRRVPPLVLAGAVLALGATPSGRRGRRRAGR